MNKFLLCALLIILFSGPALADTLPNYVEGDVLVSMQAPPFCGNMSAFTHALQEQAEALAKKHGLGLEVRRIFPEWARSSGMNWIFLRSEHKRTEELIRELSSDPNVIHVERNYIGGIEPWPPPSSGGCNAGYGSIALLTVLGLLVIKKVKIKKGECTK